MPSVRSGGDAEAREERAWCPRDSGSRKVRRSSRLTRRWEGLHRRGVGNQSCGAARRQKGHTRPWAPSPASWGDPKAEAACLSHEVQKASPVPPERDARGASYLPGQVLHPRQPVGPQEDGAREGGSRASLFAAGLSRHRQAAGSRGAAAKPASTCGRRDGASRRSLCAAQPPAPRPSLSSLGGSGVIHRGAVYAAALARSPHGEEERKVLFFLQDVLPRSDLPGPVTHLGQVSTAAAASQGAGGAGARGRAAAVQLGDSARL